MRSRFISQCDGIPADPPSPGGSYFCCPKPNKGAEEPERGFQTSPIEHSRSVLDLGVDRLEGLRVEVGFDLFAL